MTSNLMKYMYAILKMVYRITINCYKKIRVMIIDQANAKIEPNRIQKTKFSSESRAVNTLA